MEEYERYRMYHEQMMAMRQMPPQDPYHSMGMPPGMSPYEMEQYHHYSMMQSRMGGGPPTTPQMGRGGYPAEGDHHQQQQQHHQKHGLSHEEMKRYQAMKQHEQHMAAMQHQMRTAHHHQHHQQQQQQQQYHGTPYGPPSMGASSSMPPEYPGMSSPSSIATASRMSTPLSQGMKQQLPSTPVASNDNTTECNNDGQEMPSNTKGKQS